jgi:hypothetical protein
MEGLTRLVTDSLARHGFDRPIDPRRLQWSRWFRCDSPHSLLVVPSRPGIFALAEEIAAFCGASENRSHNSERSEVSLAVNSRAMADAFVGSSEQNSGNSTNREGHDFSPAENGPRLASALAAEASARRMLAVIQFSEDDDMAFTLDRMFTRINPMRERLASGRCFLRFVVIEDREQRRSICSALNQWMISSAEKSTGIPAEPDRVGRTLRSAPASIIPSSAQEVPATGSRFVQVISEVSGPHFDSGANKNLHCPQPIPSGF